MNSIRISYIVLILCVSFVCANGFYLNYITDELYERAEEIDVDAEGAKARAEELYSFFDKHQRLISITVPIARSPTVVVSFCPRLSITCIVGCLLFFELQGNHMENARRFFVGQFDAHSVVGLGGLYGAFDALVGLLKAEIILNFLHFILPSFPLVLLLYHTFRQKSIPNFVNNL